MPRAPHAHGAATALPAVWPPALTSELNGSYSEALYGAAGRLPADLRVVWPSLLSDAARRALAGAVECRFHPRLPPNALHFTADAIQHQQAALWVYQRSDPPFAPTGTTPRWRTARSPACAAATSSAHRRCGSSWCRARASPSTWVGRSTRARSASARRASVGCTALVSGDYRNFHKQLCNLTAEEEVEAEVRCSRRGAELLSPAPLEYDSVQFPGWEAAVRRLLVLELVDARVGPRGGVGHRAPRPPPLWPRAARAAAGRRPTRCASRGPRAAPRGGFPRPFRQGGSTTAACRSRPTPAGTATSGSADAERRGRGAHTASATTRPSRPTPAGQPDFGDRTLVCARRRAEQVGGAPTGEEWAAHVRHREEVRARVVPTVGSVG